MRDVYLKRTSKEENIAIRLSGKVKNFTGRGPAVIQVKFNSDLATVKFKWILNNSERSFLTSCTNHQDLVETMQTKLFENVKGNLLRAFSEVFNCEVKILDVNEESFQEKLSIKAQIKEIAS